MVLTTIIASVMVVGVMIAMKVILGDDDQLVSPGLFERTPNFDKVNVIGPRNLWHF